MIVLEIESVDLDFCEIGPVRVINIDVQSMLECGPAPMTCYAHAVAVYFTGTVRQTCNDFFYFLWVIHIQQM